MALFKHVVHGSDLELTVASFSLPEGTLYLLRPTQSNTMPPEIPDAFGLTSAEKAVARWLACRLTNKEIAAELELSPHTVKHHVASILMKLDASSRKEVARMLNGRPRLAGGTR